MRGKSVAPVYFPIDRSQPNIPRLRPRLSHWPHFLNLGCGFLLNRLKEITTDYYEDVIKLKWHAGKSWIAPKVLILEHVRLSP